MREENLKHHKIKGSQVQQGRKKQNSKVIKQHKQNFNSLANYKIWCK